MCPLTGFISWSTSTYRMWPRPTRRRAKSTLPQPYLRAAPLAWPTGFWACPPTCSRVVCNRVSKKDYKISIIRLISSNSLQHLRAPISMACAACSRIWLLRTVHWLCIAALRPLWYVPSQRMLPASLALSWPTNSSIWLHQISSEVISNC